MMYTLYFLEYFHAHLAGDSHGKEASRRLHNKSSTWERISIYLIIHIIHIQGRMSFCCAAAASASRLCLRCTTASHTNIDMGRKTLKLQAGRSEVGHPCKACEEEKNNKNKKKKNILFCTKRTRFYFRRSSMQWCHGYSIEADDLHSSMSSRQSCSTACKPRPLFRDCPGWKWKAPLQGLIA